jgi:hypothetical protein
MRGFLPVLESVQSQRHTTGSPGSGSPGQWCHALFPVKSLLKQPQKTTGETVSGIYRKISSDARQRKRGMNQNSCQYQHHTMEPPTRACYTLQARNRIWNISCLSYFTCSEAQKQRARRCHNSISSSQGGPISLSTLQGRYYLLWLSSLKYASVGFELQARSQTVRRRIGEHSFHSSERGMPFHSSQCNGNIIIGLPAPANSEVQNMGCSFLR